MGKSLETEERTSLGDALFSPVQQRVLGLLFGQPHREFQSSELIAMVDAGTGATHRVLQRLAQSGLVHVRTSGRQKYYQANRDSPIFDELTGLVRKTVGLAEPLREALQPLAESITAAFVYGSIAKGSDRADSDIDVIVVGHDLDYGAVFQALEAAERALGRKINPTVMTPEEWQTKATQSDSFVSRVMAGPRVFLLGDEHAD